MFRRALSGATATVVAFGLGCGAEETQSGTGGAGGSGGTIDCASALDPEPAAPDWCFRFIAGPPGGNSVAVDWSAAHARVRFFAPLATYAEADQALAGAFALDAAFEGDDLSAYTTALPGVACSAAATTDVLGPTQVTMDGDVAIVRPGVGPVELPAGAAGVLVDLRGVPAVGGARDAMLAAAASALATPVPGLPTRVRKHTGMVDEVFSATNLYTNAVAVTPAVDIAPAGAVDLPLAVLTSPVMSPDAVEIALTLRLANRAWLVGEDLRVEVAESRWQGIGSLGIASRHRDLMVPGSARVPDVLAADQRTSQPQCFASELLARGPVPGVVLGEDTRPAVVKAAPFDQEQDAGDVLGDARAALVIAHGAARLFYPYFPTVGDDIDPRLEETLASLPAAPTRTDEYQALRRFGHALTDGHNFVFDNEAMAAGYFAVFIEDVDGQPVVRRSATPNVDPGDTITTIDGVPAATFYALELARSGGASPGYNFNIATRQYLRMSGPTTFGLVEVAGNSKNVLVDPQPVDNFLALNVASSRPSGFLADLAAPELYYINMHSTVTASLASFNAALAEAAPAQGLVVDMRGYPGIDHYSAARSLVQTAFSSPVFRVPVLTGLDGFEIDESSYALTPLGNPSFSGPIVLLVGHATVSAAENFSTMLVDADRVTVIGRASAATNGNITGVQIPGDFTFTFTGMEIRHADPTQSVFHGVGIVPDIEVALSAAAFANGEDPELDAAITYLLQL